jgi:hypothetical protein
MANGTLSAPRAEAANHGRSGVPVLVNTSFNAHQEPIIDAPALNTGCTISRARTTLRNRSRRRTKLLKDEFFRGCVGQAIDMGYRRFELTPCTGDIFMDRGIFRKPEHLESAAAVEGYTFRTNFSIPRARDIKRLLELGKLSSFSISVCGYDAKTFVSLTRSTEKVYRRLVYNLETLLAEVGRRRVPVRAFPSCGRGVATRPRQRNHPPARPCADGRNCREGAKWRL